MEFSVKTGHPEKQRTNCIIAGVYENRRLSAIAEKLDTTNDGFISNILRKGDMDGKPGQLLLLHNVPSVSSDRVLLVGCGRERELGEKEFREIIRKTITSLSQTGAIEAVCFLTELNVKGRDIRWKIKQAVEVTAEIFYVFDKFKSKKVKDKKALRRLIFTVPTRRDLEEGERGLAEGKAVALGVALAKDLGNTPPNVCNPNYLAKEAEKLAQTLSNIRTTILDEKQILSLGMGALTAVGQGSLNPPRLITLEYTGRKDKQKPIVLVGKGITFDTGGNSIKPPMAMIGMKFDMCGAAAILATIRAIAELELPINVVGVIASAENMPGNAATRPEDIITTLSGITVEILNTDAEGRLVLCDALTYSERFDPEVVIDVATLTSSCILTFGPYVNALFSNHNPLANDLLNASITSQDRAWQMPIFDEYQDHLKSNFADIANIGNNAPEAGAILSACFLSRFTKKYHWAHIDIAGTASRGGKDRGATGRPVPLLVQYLLDKC